MKKITSRPRLMLGVTLFTSFIFFVWTNKAMSEFYTMGGGIAYHLWLHLTIGLMLVAIYLLIEGEAK